MSTSTGFHKDASSYSDLLTKSFIFVGQLYHVYMFADGSGNPGHDGASSLNPRCNSP